jgi:hypothetical protein
MITRKAAPALAAGCTMVRASGMGILRLVCPTSRPYHTRNHIRELNRHSRQGVYDGPPTPWPLTCLTETRYYRNRQMHSVGTTSDYANFKHPSSSHPAHSLIVSLHV